MGVCLLVKQCRPVAAVRRDRHPLRLPGPQRGVHEPGGGGGVAAPRQLRMRVGHHRRGGAGPNEQLGGDGTGLQRPVSRRGYLHGQIETIKAVTVNPEVVTAQVEISLC